VVYIASIIDSEIRAKIKAIQAAYLLKNKKSKTQPEVVLEALDVYVQKEKLNIGG
jgi:hypothetical protein